MDTTVIEATIHTARQLQVLRERAASIRRGDQVALLAPEGTDGQDIAGAVTAVRASIDDTVALVVANRVHFVPADHDVVIIRDPAQSGARNGGADNGEQPRGAWRAHPGCGPRDGVGERGLVTPAMPVPPRGAATRATDLCAEATT